MCSSVNKPVIYFILDTPAYAPGPATNAEYAIPLFAPALSSPRYSISPRYAPNPPKYDQSLSTPAVYARSPSLTFAQNPLYTPFPFPSHI